MKFQFLPENFSRSENAPPFETRKIRLFEVERIFLKNKKMLEELTRNPYEILNVTGPETAGVEETALLMGKLMGKEVHFSCEKPGEYSYLNNSGKMCRLLGYPRVSLNEMIRLQAEWISNGGLSIGKPTHFEVNNGKF